ncbi:wiskott-Aldrich syndrome protein homolog 1-like [Rhinopithecus roxellana]|uniref:wiskott-Aldrich syndrome protein homolog 1-like n=1 Tax=Rhinopithecus roxellana TaxID=61622 RepID=UPI00123765AA|nr:wiskott-Aldrich syndrome protein homolog 1-like [Rhinopithecus roxellana]
MTEGFNKPNDEEIQRLIQHQLSTSHGPWVFLYAVQVQIEGMLMYQVWYQALDSRGPLRSVCGQSSGLDSFLAYGLFQASHEQPHLREQRPRIPQALACGTVFCQKRHCGAAPAHSHSSGKTRAAEAYPAPLPLPPLPPAGLRAAVSDSSQQPPQQPRRRHCLPGLAHRAQAAECPWTRISSQSSCFLGQPKPQVRTSAVEVTPRACGSQRPGGLLLSSLPEKPPWGRLQRGHQVLPGALGALLLRRGAPAQVLLKVPLWTPETPRQLSAPPRAPAATRPLPPAPAVPRGPPTSPMRMPRGPVS